MLYSKLFNNIILDNNVIFDIPLSKQNRIEVNGGNLKISKLTVEDSGMYQCIGENKHGKIYASAELYVQGNFWLSKN